MPGVGRVWHHAQCQRNVCTKEENSALPIPLLCVLSSCLFFLGRFQPCPACHADHPNWQLLTKTACDTSSCIFFTGPSTWSWRVLGASRAAEVRPFHSSPVCTSS